MHSFAFVALPHVRFEPVAVVALSRCPSPQQQIFCTSAKFYDAARRQFRPFVDHTAFLALYIYRSSDNAAMRAVLPADAVVAAVGGITPDTMASYHAAGADGYGLGSALFKPNYTLDDIGRRARAFTSVLEELG